MPTLRARPYLTLSTRTSARWTALVALVACFGALAPHWTQAQTRAQEPRSAAVTGVCTLLRASALRGAAAELVHPRAPLAIAATATGAIIAARARASDDLWLIRVDDSLARADEDRLVGGPVTSFALAAAPGGAVLAMAERVARDGRDAHDDVLLARLDTVGNARNVPRSLGRVLRCDGVTARPSATGFVVAWGSLDGPTTTTVTTDARGVPNARARVVVDASMPRMVALTGETRFAVSVSGPSGSSLLHLDESGASVEAFALGGTPVALVALPNAVLTFSTVSESLAFARWWPSSALVETNLALPRSITAATHVSASSADRASAVLLVDDRAGREHLVRVSIDGTTSLLASFAGARGAVTHALDGASLLTVTHGTAGGLDLARWSCPRVIQSTIAPAPSTSTIADAATTVDASAAPEFSDQTTP